MRTISHSAIVGHEIATVCGRAVDPSVAIISGGYIGVTVNLTASYGHASDRYCLSSI